MSDFGLTQEQIDAMMKTVETPGGGGTSSAGAAQALADFERETMGNLPSVLNAMTGFEYQLANVECTPTNPGEIPALLGGELVFSIPIHAGEQYTHFLVLDAQFARSIASALTGSEAEDDGSLSEMALSAVLEVVSQANGTYLTNLARALGLPVNGEALSLVDAASAAAQLGEGAMLTVLNLQQGSGESAVVSHLLPGGLAGRIMDKINEASAPPQAASAAVSARPAMQAAAAAPAMPVMQAAAAVHSSGSIVAGGVQYSPATFSPLTPPGMAVDARNLDILLDVPLQVTVELGKTAIPIRQILEYGQGSLITLDKLAGEPIDLLVNGKYFAKGEVVVIDENFGVRITSILSPADRIAQLS